MPTVPSSGSIRHAGGCLQPVLLRGRVDHIDGSTGELIHRYTTVHEPGGLLPVACKTRRASRCAPCAEVYRADTYQLIRAGLTGGKGVPAEVAHHPYVFVTLTAPSFGPVHARRVRGERVLACRPRRNGRACPHGIRLSCNEKHTRDDDRLGEPLCPACYDYTGSVLFNAHAPELWRRFTITLRRTLARRAGLNGKAFAAQARLSYAKVAEYQRRGVVHFHAIVRLDGPVGPSAAPPAWATLGLLTDAIGQAARTVQVRTPAARCIPSRTLRVKDPETGVSKPRWVGGFATEEAAKAARDESRVKARRGEYVDRNRITVAAYLDDWIDSHAMEIKPRTLQDYRACLRLYVMPRIGHLQVQAVRPSTITKLYRDLLTSGGRDGQPLAVATVTHLHAVLRKAFRDAVTVDEIINSNPVERAKRPRAQAHEPGTVWTVTQLRGFLATARQHRLFAFFHVAAYTGARRGELLNLRWTDVDFNGKKITITGSTAVIAGERVNRTTKSGRTRVVSIDDETISVLRQHKADQAADQTHAGDSWRGVKDGYAFTTGWGEPIYPDTVTSLMTKLIAAHDEPDDGPRPRHPLPHARLHDLRHIHATTLLLSGVPVHVVAARLGHADPAITLRVYAPVIRTAEAAAADIFADAVKAA